MVFYIVCYGWSSCIHHKRLLRLFVVVFSSVVPPCVFLSRVVLTILVVLGVVPPSSGIEEMRGLGDEDLRS
jgi:hypothetical protein